ncbi:MAG: TetR/AcrR family transcriptional regulator [Gammaproteobacteria bacterium]|nr:TetR/AcrR family transcriptional regulator [Gammaproteobacteria bacterium]
MATQNTSSKPPRAGTAARKASILDAALRCFSGQGLESTTVHDIQRAANCSIGSIYHHFGSKEGVAEALFIDGVQSLNQGMLQKLRRCRSGEACVRAVVGQYCAWSTRNQQLARYLHSRDIDFSEEAKARLKVIYREYIGAVFAIFGPFVENGEIRVLPVDVYVPLISGPIQDYVRRWLSGDHRDSPRKVEALFADAAWNAVKG